MTPLGIAGRSEAIAAPRVNIVAVVIFLASLALGLALTAATANPIPLLVIVPIGVILMQSPRIAQQWERAGVLRLGKLIGLQGPRGFCIVPFIAPVSSGSDH